ERDLARAAAPARARLAAAPPRGRRVPRSRGGARRAGHLAAATRRGPPRRRGGRMMIAIEVRDLFRVHSTPEGDAAALQGLTLSVREGEVVTVLGPSGSGKTTLLRILGGLDRPSAGPVRVFGTDRARPARRVPTEHARLRRPALRARARPRAHRTRARRAAARPARHLRERAPGEGRRAPRPCRPR